MNKVILGVLVAFSLSTVAPAFAGDEGGDAKETKAPKKASKKKDAKKTDDAKGGDAGK
jgi:hypothetical protein